MSRIDDESRPLSDGFFPQKTSWSERKKHMGARFPKIITKLSWRECCSRTERQWARPFLRISVICADKTLCTCANGKRALFRDNLQKVSSGHMKYILKGIQYKCFQVMSLLTGPEMSPPTCRRRGNRDGDKFLCNRCPLKHEAWEREGWSALQEHI